MKFLLKTFCVNLLGGIMLLIGGCEKINKAEVSGNIKEKGTHIPFPNVGVYIERTNYSGESNRTYPTIVANTISDSKGNFHLQFHMGYNYSYRLFCMPLDDENGKTYSATSGKILPNKISLVNLELPPFAYMKIHLLKTSYTTTESMTMIFDANQSINVNVPNHPIDTIQGVYRVTGNDSVNIFWYQYYSSSPTLYTSGSSSLYINRGDTLTYDINLL